MPTRHIPVIVGIGEVTHRTKDLAAGLEPLALMDKALREAERDAGAALLQQVDSLDIVCEISWPYADAPGLLSQRLGIAPRRQVYGVIGGETPVQMIHEAALRIARGETQVAAIVGAESQYTVVNAQKAGVELDWTPRDPHPRIERGAAFLHPLCVQHGVTSPPTVYPFYENASQAAWGMTPRQALAESGALWSRYSQVAAANPYSWSRQPFSAEEITTPTPANRLIAWPYTLRMVANPQVNQGAAVLVTSEARALALGIPRERLVYVWSGSAAREPRQYLERDQYTHSHAQNAVLEAVRAQAGGLEAFELLELYSCFPIVPKMARRTLGLAADAQMTSTGGHSFFGAALNDYMTHAACGLVRGLRQLPGKLALLYGQGEYVTKHHAIVLAARPPEHDQLTENYSVQAEADARRGPVPPLVLDYAGAATLETFTILYARDGTPQHGVVIARTPQGGRLMARVEAADTATLARLTDLDASPIGLPGQVANGAADGLLRWTLA
jgi:acetyl-CoA C-acetyltransferase